ncbi:hypothetical protein ACC702_40170, partial [Rhizobium ruizarguesonis]
DRSNHGDRGQQDRSSLLHSGRREPSDAAGWPTFVATVVLILALAATYHLTAYFCTALVCGTVVMECLRQGASAMQK